MANLICTIGVPGCGKSTWAEALTKDNSEVYSWVSRDGIRDSIMHLSENYSNKRPPNSVYFGKETVVYNEYIRLIKDSLRLGYDTIADATLCSKKGIMKFFRAIDSGTRVDYENKVAVVFSTPIEECIKRNANRRGWKKVPEQAIEEMYQDLLNVGPTVYSYFDIVVTENWEVLYDKDE